MVRSLCKPALLYLYRYRFPKDTFPSIGPTHRSHSRAILFAPLYAYPSSPPSSTSPAKIAPHSLVLADDAATTFYTPAEHPLLLAHAAATTLFTVAALLLMFADAAANILFARAPYPLVLADAAAATLFTSTPLPLCSPKPVAADSFSQMPLPPQALVSKEFESVYPMCKNSTAPLNFIMQEYLNLVDRKGLELPSTDRRCKASVKKFKRSPTVLAEWIALKETLATFQAVRGKETSDNKESMI